MLAGVGITAYRNDFVREGAHAAHQDALYTRLEAALGGPAFGTVRALEQSAAAQPTAEPTGLGDEAAVRTAIAVPSPPVPSAPSLNSDDSHPLAGSTPPVVSLESLAPEKNGQAAPKVEAATATPAPARAAASQPKQTAAPVAAKPAPVRAAATPKAAAVEKPAPIAQKPASEMTDRERLNAAIGQSMMQSAPLSPRAANPSPKPASTIP